jgi:hypothetical protein
MNKLFLILLILLIIIIVTLIIIAYYYFYDRTTVTSETPKTRWIWNRTIASTCDFAPSKIKCDSIFYSAKDYQKLIDLTDKSCISIYVIGRQLHNFIDETLHHIKRPFILVTGCSDLGPFGSLNNQQKHDLTSNIYLKYWFAQNLDYFEEPNRIFAIPIGIDYHTLWKSSTFFLKHRWGSKGSPLEQEMELTNIREDIKNKIALSSKSSQGYAQFGTLNRGNRKSVWNDMSKSENACYLDTREKIPRTELWKKYGSYFFIVSVSGGGIDCHRTWEALILGCAVIVEDLPLNRLLLKNLPALFISDWKSITKKFLEDKKKEFIEKWDLFDWDRLKSEYWFNLIEQYKSKVNEINK